jgi:adenosine kinase
MINHSKECHDASIPILFDPGQGLPMFNQKELIAFIEQASYIAVNDYEAEVLSKVTKFSIEEISKKVTALIITKGSEGSLIYTNNQTIKIDPFPAEKIIDPTGCGDAYRSGLTYGIVNKLSWEKTGWLASIMGGIKIQSQGGQNHTASISDIESYFGESLR